MSPTKLDRPAPRHMADVEPPAGVAEAIAAFFDPGVGEVHIEPVTSRYLGNCHWEVTADVQFIESARDNERRDFLIREAITGPVHIDCLAGAPHQPVNTNG